MGGIPYEIPNILESIRKDLQSNRITIYQAAEELYDHGWLNFIDVEKEKSLLEQKE